MRTKWGLRLANANPLVASTLNKLLRRGDSGWRALEHYGQVYSPKSITDECFSWHALLPSDTFVPTYIYPTQDEYIHVLTGESDLVLGGEHIHANTGDLVLLLRGALFHK